MTRLVGQESYVMRLAQAVTSLSNAGQLEANVRDLLLHDKEAFNLFFEEAKRKGVKISLEDPPAARTVTETMRAQEAKKDSTVKEEALPMRAVIQREHAETSDIFLGNEKIIEKLRWNSHESGTARNLASLLQRIKELGIEDPNSYLSLRDAAQKSGVAERTLRRYIADGQLETEKVKGPRGWEHRVYVPALFSVLQQKAGAFERAHSNPMDEMGRELATLCRAIVEQQTLADRRTNKLLDEIRNQSRLMDELRTEQKEARGQMFAIQDQMIKFLSPPPKKSFFEKLFKS